MLRRVIYHSMQLSFQRGRLVANPFTKTFQFGPNLDIIPKASFAYEQAAEEDKAYHDHILQAHRNLLRDAVYFLYCHDRVADAARWYEYLGKKYPDRTLLEGKTNSFPRNTTLEEYALGRMQVDIDETMSRDRIENAIEALLVNSYRSIALGEDARAAGYRRQARLVLTTYESKTKGTGDRIRLDPLEETERKVLNYLLDPEEGAPPDWRAALRSRLGLPPEITPPPPGTNAAPQGFSSK